MPLSQNQKAFCQFIVAFSKSTLNFEHFQKQDDPHSLCISEITDSEKVVRYLSKKSRFSRPLDMQHGKRARKLLESEREPSYHI